MYSLTIENYSDKSFVIRGNDTIKFKDTLKEFGGKWNSMLKNGGGWIFSNIHKSKLEKFVEIINMNTTEKVQEFVDENSGIEIEELNDKYFIVKGNTKSLKDKFKSLGGKWNSAKVGWTFPNDKQDEIVNIIDEYEEVMSINL
jgi:hypothetical protein